MFRRNSPVLALAALLLLGVAAPAQVGQGGGGPGGAAGGGSAGGGPGGIGGARPGKMPAPPRPTPGNTTPPPTVQDNRPTHGDTVAQGGNGQVARGGGGLPRTPATPAQSPTPPYPPLGAGSPPAGRPTTVPGAGASGQVDPHDWRVWWELNQHEYLRLKAAVWDPGSWTGDAGFVIGSGAPRKPLRGLRPTPDQLGRLAAPGLREVLAGESQPDILASALVALGKMGAVSEPENGAANAQVLLGFLRHANREVVELAVLGLGLQDDRDLLFELSAILRDDTEGRVLLGTTEVPVRTRAFAAYAMGLFAERHPAHDVQRFVVDRVVGVIETEARSKELGVACVNALALVEPPSATLPLDQARELAPHATRESLVEYLLDLLGDRRTKVRVRAHVPRALARLIDPQEDPLKEEVVEGLLAALARGRLSNRELRIGCVQALGLLGTAGSDPVDARIRDGLMKAVRRGDPASRHLALIALGKVSSRPGENSKNPLAGARTVREFLLDQLVRGKSRTRPWAALALGVRGFYLRDQGLPQNQEISTILQELLRDERSPDDVAAYSLALGLRGDLRAAELLREKLAEMRVEEPRAQVALALGLMDSTGSSDLLRDVLESSVNQPFLMRGCAAALAMLRDKDVVLHLIDRMAAAPSSVVKAQYAWTLAWVGDSRSIPPLVELLRRDDLPAATRSLAALGLGWIGEPTELPWKARLASDANYLASTSSFYRPIGGGVLNVD